VLQSNEAKRKKEKKGGRVEIKFQAYLSE